MEKQEKIKYFIEIKRDFLREVSNYESKILFFLLAISSALIVYFYKNPTSIKLLDRIIPINWIVIFIFCGILIIFYEAFYIWLLEYHYKTFKEEIEKEKIKNFELKFHHLAGNFILDFLRKKKHQKGKKGK